ncbi:hypothetical protein Aduo_018452 [Ancylostoma duodenale]
MELQKSLVVGILSSLEWLHYKANHESFASICRCVSVDLEVRSSGRAAPAFSAFFTFYNIPKLVPLDISFATQHAASNASTIITRFVIGEMSIP